MNTRQPPSYVSILFHSTLQPTEWLADIALKVTHKAQDALTVEKMPLPLSLNCYRQQVLVDRLNRSTAVYYACPKTLPVPSVKLHKHFQVTLNGGPLGSLWVGFQRQSKLWHPQDLAELGEIRWPQQVRSSASLLLSASSQSLAWPSAAVLPSVQLIHHLSVLATALSHWAAACAVSQSRHPPPSPQTNVSRTAKMVC